MDQVRQIDGVPEQLGDYRLLGRIGEGGMGTVYEGLQGRLRRRVALKVLAPRLSRDEVFLGRFRREAVAAAAINHPNLIQVYDIGEEEGCHFYAMEFVEGENVGQRIKREGALPCSEALAIAMAVTDALAEVHARDIVHRDIKPENIMIDTRGHVKLADLGLAKCLADETAVTLTGAGMGSPHYMAPEQARDAGNVDRRADIYSLGITLLTMLTGRRPFQATSPYLLARAHAEDPLPSGADLGTPLPPGLESLIARLSEKDPEARFQDCADVRKALLEAIGGLPTTVRPSKDTSKSRELSRQIAAGEASLTTVSTTVTAPPIEATTRSGQRRFWQSAGWAGAAIALIVGVVWAWPRGGTTEDNATPAPEAHAEETPPEESGPEMELTEDELVAMLLGPETAGPDGIPERRPRRLPLPAQVRGILIPDSQREELRYRLPTGLPVMLNQLSLRHLRGLAPEEIWSDTESYARDRPEDYRGLIARYMAIQQSATAPGMRKEAVLRLEHYANLLEAACRREVEAFTLEMKLLLEEGRPKEAYEVWRRFPRPMLIFKHEPMIYDIIRTNIPALHLPSDFGLDRREAVGVRFRGLPVRQGQ